MDWTVPFIIYRVDQNCVGEQVTLEEAYYPEDFKKAQYLIKFVAEAGDVLCRTPLHHKYDAEEGRPQYVSHKVSSGNPSRDYEDWLKLLGDKKFDGKFPEEQVGTPEE